MTLSGLWERIKSRDVAFTTPDVQRVFLACKECRRLKPHYDLYAKIGYGKPLCKCGSIFYRPTRIPEWKAAWLVLVVGWLWRNKIRKCDQWDPRLPIR